jgi:hypothetical protein
VEFLVVAILPYSTTLLQINSTAKYNPDGSLDYTDGMPVTPLVLKLRKQRKLPKAESPPPEIPRLDLGTLCKKK